MRQPWRRLIACLSLAAFVLTNTPGALAALSSAVPAIPLCTQQDCCLRCSHHAAHDACCSSQATPSDGPEVLTSEGLTQKAAAPQSMPRDKQHGPCPFGPSCPCDCTWCSLA